MSTDTDVEWVPFNKDVHSL